MLKICSLNRLLLLMLLFMAQQIFAKPNYAVVVESETPSTLTFNYFQQPKEAQNVAKKPIDYIMQWTALQLLGKPYAPALLDAFNSRVFIYQSKSNRLYVIY